jgi:hypothetical protein
MNARLPNLSDEPDDPLDELLSNRTVGKKVITVEKYLRGFLVSVRKRQNAFGRHQSVAIPMEAEKRNAERLNVRKGRFPIEAIKALQ